MTEKYPTLPVCKQYHPKSELRNRPGYYPNISPAQLKAVNELVALCEKNNLNIKYDNEDEFLKLLRFLRARKFVVAKSFEMLQKDIQWRSQENRFNIRNETASEALGCDVNKILPFFPNWIQGHDNQQRPVSYRLFGKFYMWEVLKLTSMQRLLRFHAWETEQALKIMEDKGAELDLNLETFTIIVDAAGLKLKLANSDAFSFIKGMIGTDSDHYPERLGMLVIINAPVVLSGIWKVVKTFLDDVTKAKIKIFGTNQKEWLPVLLQSIDIDQIPAMYGGTAPNPDFSSLMASISSDSDNSDLTQGDVDAQLAEIAASSLDITDSEQVESYADTETFSAASSPVKPSSP